MVVAALLAVAGLRTRANQLKHGITSEPAAFFYGKLAIFSALLVGFSYLLASYKGLPNVLIVMALLIALFDFVTSRTTIGRRIYALGGNEKAAKLSGIKTDRLAFYTFVNMGVLAAVAGLVFAARLNTATPKAGTGFELDVIAACFIGGASASGGVGKVMGAVIGAFIMGVMNNGMSILGIGIDYSEVNRPPELFAPAYALARRAGSGSCAQAAAAVPLSPRAMAFSSRAGSVTGSFAPVSPTGRMLMTRLASATSLSCQPAEAGVSSRAYIARCVRSCARSVSRVEAPPVATALSAAICSGDPPPLASAATSAANGRPEASAVWTRPASTMRAAASPCGLGPAAALASVSTVPMRALARSSC